VLLWDFLPCKAVCDDIIYRDVSADFVNVGIQMLNTRTEETYNGHRHLDVHTGLTFRKVAYSNMTRLP